MFEDKDSPTKFEVDIENMKVTDIKKKLKALGLSVAGNKSELVDRLQVAMISGKDSSGDACCLPDSLSDISPNKLNELLGDSPPFVKEEILATQDQLVTSVTPSVPTSVAPSLPTSVTPSVPLKKRAVLQTEVETVKPKKRFVLNRNNFPTPILSQAVVEPLKVESSLKADNGKEAIAMESDEIPTTSGSVEKVVQTKKVLSDAERMLMRAKRFNLNVEAIKAQNVLVPAKKKTITERKSKVSAISSYTAPPNIEVLKKRGARFGENVSSVLKKLEDREKINKRESKFGQGLGEIKVTSLDDEEMKKMRAERFKKLNKKL